MLATLTFTYNKIILVPQLAHDHLKGLPAKTYVQVEWPYAYIVLDMVAAVIGRIDNQLIVDGAAGIQVLAGQYQLRPALACYYQFGLPRLVAWGVERARLIAFTVNLANAENEYGQLLLSILSNLVENLPEFVEHLGGGIIVLDIGENH